MMIFENDILQSDLNAAIRLLAEWCVAICDNGTDWDNWDEYYKYAMYRKGPLRLLLDEAIAKVREERSL